LRLSALPVRRDFREGSDFCGKGDSSFNVIAKRESVVRLTNDEAISICFFVFVEKEIATPDFVNAENDKVE
jgi:hypothetical protein